MIEWRTISVNENYEVSEDGEVRRMSSGPSTYSGRMLKPRKDKKGYSLVNLSRNGKQKPHRIHRLVVQAFLGNPPTEKHQIAHGDGNPENNHVSNLRWATQKENEADKIIHGKTSRGEKHGNSKLTKDDVGKIRFLISQGHSNTEIAKMFGVDHSHISKIKRGKSWSWLN